MTSTSRLSKHNLHEVFCFICRIFNLSEPVGIYLAETLAGNTRHFALRSNNFANVLTPDRTLQRLLGTDLNVFVFLPPVLGLELQGELSALPSLRSRQPFAHHD
jgi:hypothetical protein